MDSNSLSPNASDTLSTFLGALPETHTATRKLLQSALHNARSAETLTLILMMATATAELEARVLQLEAR